MFREGGYFFMAGPAARSFWSNNQIMVGPIDSRRQKLTTSKNSESIKAQDSEQQSKEETRPVECRPALFVTRESSIHQYASSAKIQNA
ncbi:MAG: hypothetical protein IJG85_07615 [Eubacteriaceae bacterium]|nr:hypothetical protein [Eubacteriaceae bacterium]